MKLSTLVLASTMIVAPGIAFAQSSPSPANQTGPGVHPTTQQPTDQGAGNATGNTKATSGSAAKSGSSMKSGTTGAATTDKSDKLSSPTGSKADPDAKK